MSRKNQKPEFQKTVCVEKMKTAILLTKPKTVFENFEIKLFKNRLLCRHVFAILALKSPFI